MYTNFLRRRAEVAFGRWRHSVKSIGEISPNANVLIVAVKHELAETQIFPFYFYQDALRKDHGVRFVELGLPALMAQMESGKAVGATNTTIKRIFFQPELHMDGERQARVLAYLKSAFPNARIALLDWFAPLHIRYATTADEYIDIYVKKQIYRNFHDFERPTVGDTNLNDYYARRFAISDEPMQFTAPPGFESKLRLGSNFGLSPQMVDLFLGPVPEEGGRDIDLHARIAVKGVPWYAVMRQESKDVLKTVSDLKVVSEGRVKRPEFFRELRRSKICFSPFGYGEVCWRDYEAFATGSLLLKPDMSHLVVTPDSFVAHKTYVPIQWDLSDFESTVRETLARFDQTRDMRRHAFDVMQRWILSKDAARDIAALC